MHEETINVEESEDGFPAIFNDVIQLPTVRGHGGEYNWDNNWLTTGSGVQKGLIARWREQDSYPVAQSPQNKRWWQLKH